MAAVKSPAKPAGTESLIKSRDRVRDLAEVYTAKKEVDAMLDLIPDFSLNQTFLEPACGNGNFLIEILRRKLQIFPGVGQYFEGNAAGKIASLPKNGKSDVVLMTALKAVSTMYGIDICANNVAETQVRLYSYIVYGEDLSLPPFLTGGDPQTFNYIEAVTPGHALPLAEDYLGNLFRYAEAEAIRRGLRTRISAISPLIRDVLKVVLRKNFQQGDFLSQKTLEGADLVVSGWEWSKESGKKGEPWEPAEIWEPWDPAKSWKPSEPWQVCRKDYRLAVVGTKDPKTEFEPYTCNIEKLLEGGENA